MKKINRISIGKAVCWRRRLAGLPVWLCRALAQPPRRGEGLHAWLFSTARQLHAHLHPEEICDLFGEITEAEEREIQDAVQNSIACAWQPSRRRRFKPRGMVTGMGKAPRDPRERIHQAPGAGRISAAPTPAKVRLPAQPKWPGPNLEKIEAIARAGRGLAGLRERSPYIFREDDPQRYTAWILRQLFVAADNPDPYLCCGLDQRNFDTHRLSEWGTKTWKLQFVVPSPMTGEFGRAKAGHLSAHALDNTGPRRFLVIECDFSTLSRDGRAETRYAPLIQRLAGVGITVPDICASVLFHLDEYLPLVMALSSGGKSEHGWFWVEGLSDSELLTFMRYAVSLGADHATWTRSQFVRMPDGTRNNGKRQLVHYFNPQPMETARPKRAT